MDAKPQLSNRSRKLLAAGSSFDNKGKISFMGNPFARELAEMPDHSNTATRETEDRLGVFIFDRPESPR